MSGLQRLFGKKKEDKVTTGDAIQKLREMEDTLTKRQQFLEKKIQDELKLAKQHGTKNKRQALAALARKKRYEQQLTQIDGTLTTIEYQREALESASTNAEVLKTMQFGAQALKQAHNCNLMVPNVQVVDGDVVGLEVSYALYQKTGDTCFVCYQFFLQTQNVVQFRTSTGCQSPPNSANPVSLCLTIPPFTSVYTLFRRSPTFQNCKTLIEGLFQFTYEQDQGGGGICDSPDSQWSACQVQGSAYADNTIMYITYGYCPGNAVSAALYGKMRYQCMGTWLDYQGNVWSAIASTSDPLERFRFRCLVTTSDQMRTDLSWRLGMSRMADCSEVMNFYQAPYRYIMNPTLNSTQLDEMRPTCVLPANFSGTWYTTGQYDVAVTMNMTSIFWHMQIDQFHWQDTYFSCKQQRDSRYLMQAVTVGRCEIDFTCFDFLPRHHSIIRFRMGRPFRLFPAERASMSLSTYLVKMFRYSCAYSSFTLNTADWSYNLLILNPPSPVDCPIRGRYTFTMTGQDQEKYFTKISAAGNQIGGVTLRPRINFACRAGDTESDLASCLWDSKRMYLDVERCMTLDNWGRPMDEYNFPDNIMTCAGYWMEDLRSMMITYDPDDPISQNFRCWVYRRIDYKNYLMSRSTRARCGVNQTASSYSPYDGASLLLGLTDNEREFDGCPQFYDDGRNPFANSRKILVLGGDAPRVTTPLLLAFMSVSCALLNIMRRR